LFFYFFLPSFRRGRPRINRFLAAKHPLPLFLPLRVILPLSPMFEPFPFFFIVFSPLGFSPPSDSELLAPNIYPSFFSPLFPHVVPTIVFVEMSLSYSSPHLLAPPPLPVLNLTSALVCFAATTDICLRLSRAFQTRFPPFLCFNEYP